MEIPARVAERAASRYVVNVNGCYISTYSLGSHGYAQIGWQGGEGKVVGTTAHRAAYVAAYGQIPDSLTVDHLCRTRPCVNPLHLRLLTNVDNATDNGGVRLSPLVQKWCPSGHQMVQSTTQNYCPDCKNAYRRAWRRARRAVPLKA